MPHANAVPPSERVDHFYPFVPLEVTTRRPTRAFLLDLEARGP